MSLSKIQIKEIIIYASSIIFANEGSYGSVNKNDNGAVSIGKVQWHGNRALGLLKSICSVDSAQSKKVLGNDLYFEITAVSTNSWSSRIVTAAEAMAISSLLITTPGRKAQDTLAEADITEYVNKGISYGLTDYGALIYFADGVNQYGTASELWKNITVKALKGAGNVEAMYTATKELTENYLTRRTKVYNAILSLNLKPTGYQQEEKSMKYTAKGLVEYAAECLTLNTKYMWGSFGQRITTAFINSKKTQYPDWYTAARVSSFNALVGKDYYGFDCVGLIKSYFWGGYKNLKYDATQDKSANMMVNMATVKGDIKTIPEIPGLCVWLDGHIGVYIGSGYVIESTFNSKLGDGVCKTKLTDRQWLKWLQCPYIDYSGASAASGAVNNQNTTNAATGVSNYTVNAGDSLWAIASKLLGSGSRYNEIKTLNGLKTDVLQLNQVLKIPKK